MSKILSPLNDHSVERIPSRLRLALATPVACLLIGGVLGFMLGRFGLKSLKFTYNPEWDIAKILQAVATLGVAVYVYHFAVERSKTASDIRQHLASIARAILEPLRLLHELTRASATSVADVAGAIRTVNVATAEFVDAVEACGGTHCDTEHLSECIRRYRQDIDNYPAETMRLSQQRRLDSGYADARREINRAILTIYKG